MNRMYRIYDEAAEAWMPPFRARTDAEAMRNVEVSVNDPNETIGRRPEHFTLFCIGQYGDDSPLIESFSSAIHVCALIQLKYGEQPVLEDVSNG